MPPAPLALPLPASPMTPGELCWDSSPQPIHLPLLDEDLFCTLRSREREGGEGGGWSSVLESALDPLFQVTRVEAEVNFACNDCVIPLVKQSNSGTA